MNIIILTTFSNKEEAKRITGILLEKELVACVQLKEIESYYMWKGKIEEEKEIQGVIKTKKKLFDDVKALIEKEHSYDVPQILAVDVNKGSEEYLQWINGVTR